MFSDKVVAGDCADSSKKIPASKIPQVLPQLDEHFPFCNIRPENLSL